MARKSWLYLVSVAALGAAGCEQQGAERILPRIAASNGVEIAILERIPDLLDSDYMWTFRAVREIPTVRVGDGTLLLFEPSVALPLRNGGLFVHDPTADRPLVIVDPATAEALVRFGRSGQGPGEQREWLQLGEGDDSTLVVLDMYNRQVHRFSPDGIPISSRAYDPQTVPRKTLPAPSSGAFLVESWRGDGSRRLPGIELLAFRAREPVPLFQLPEPTASVAVEPGPIQFGRALWTTLPHGIVAMWSAAPLLRVHDLSGNLVREIHLPLETGRITDRDIQEQIAHWGPIARRLRPGPSALTNELFPVNDTVFGMLASSLWRGSEDPDLAPGRILWRLFTLRGEYLGVVEPPEDFRVLGSGRGTIWARVLDEAAYPVLQELELVREVANRGTHTTPPPNT